MDSSKNPIQNVHIVEPSLKKKRKKLLNKLEKGLLAHLALDHQDAEQAAMLDEALDALLRYYERPMGVGSTLQPLLLLCNEPRVAPPWSPSLCVARGRPARG